MSMVILDYLGHWGGFITGRAVSISLFQFRYDIDTIFTKYRDIDIK